MQEMQIMRIANNFIAGTHMHKQPIIQYPASTRRILGVRFYKLY